MAKKKKSERPSTLEIVRNEETPAESAVEETPAAERALSLVELLEWRALDAEMRLALQTLHAASLELEALVQASPQIMKKRAEIETMKPWARERQKAFAERMAEIGKVHGVDLAKCSIDDKTGRITVHE